jgi:hypothetical protein
LKELAFEKEVKEVEVEVVRQTSVDVRPTHLPLIFVNSVCIFREIVAVDVST